MLKDLKLLMSCSQDNYIREANFLQENLDFFTPIAFLSSSHANYFLRPYILSSH